MRILEWVAGVLHFFISDISRRPPRGYGARYLERCYVLMISISGVELVLLFLSSLVSLTVKVVCCWDIHKNLGLRSFLSQAKSLTLSTKLVKSQGFLYPLPRARWKNIRCYGITKYTEIPHQLPSHSSVLYMFPPFQDIAATIFSPLMISPPRLSPEIISLSTCFSLHTVGGRTWKRKFLGSRSS